MPGCRVQSLDVMRYVPVASKAYMKRCLPDGFTAQAVAEAPSLAWNRDDALQDELVRRVFRRNIVRPLHFVPTAEGFGAAVRAGLGWGMFPESLVASPLDDGSFVRVSDVHLDVPLLLPTIESIWLGTLSDATPAIDGPVFISAVNLTGFEFGPPPLNPYEQFKNLKPVDVIDSSVFVYNGHFEIPLAAALATTQRAGILLAEQKLPEALQEAQQAVALAPDSVPVNVTMGNVLDALGRRAEARPYYESALQQALTIQPLFQGGIVPFLKQRLAANDNAAKDPHP